MTGPGGTSAPHRKAAPVDFNSRTGADAERSCAAISRHARISHQLSAGGDRALGKTDPRRRHQRRLKASPDATRDNWPYQFAALNLAVCAFTRTKTSAIELPLTSGAN